jgi:flavin-dependent thymidylate synthase
MTDDLVHGHPYTGELEAGASCQYMYDRTHPLEVVKICARQAMEHADPGTGEKRHLLHTHPHDFVAQEANPGYCAFSVGPMALGVAGDKVDVTMFCGMPEMLHKWAERDRAAQRVAESLREKAREGKPQYVDLGLHLKPGSSLVKQADAAQYERPPMPDAARRGPVVTLIDAPVDPLGTLAVIGGIYTGNVARSKAEVTDAARRAMLADMQKTVLDGPLEAIQFTFLIEGVSRSFTHQAVRNRFSFFAQESLRFAVASDWAQEVPLPPSLASLPQDHPAVGVWLKALNQSEDSYEALVGAGMPAEEARDVLPHAITTRYYWVVSLRTLLQEAGKRTCTQAQFTWRQVMAGVAKAFREHAVHDENEYWIPSTGPGDDVSGDGWQYTAFADLIRPVCYQQGACGFMAKFDRGCTIRKKVDVFAINNIPSSQWHDKRKHGPMAIDPAEWAADPAAARTYSEEG